VTHFGGTEYPLKPGDTLLVPADEKPKTIWTGNESLKLLCFFLVPNNPVRHSGIPARDADLTADRRANAGHRPTNVLLCG
jgi:mannose-6-phosphate isomerase-like protein (cupin superfamily)